MNGIEIISQEAMTTLRIIPTILLALLILIILPITLHIGNKTDNWKLAYKFEIISGITYGFIIATILFLGLLDKPTGYYKYTVKISNECSLLEFNEQYKIIKENKDGTYVITDNLHYGNRR